MNRAIKLVSIVTLLSTSACSGMLGSNGLNSSEHGAISITADKEGMRAFSDAMTGMVTAGKASPDIVDAHHQLRGQQERETTTRKAYEALPNKNPFGKFLNKGGQK